MTHLVSENGLPQITTKVGSHIYGEGISKIEIEVGYIWIQLYATTEWIEECIAFVIMRFRNSRHQIPMLLLL